MNILIINSEGHWLNGWMTSASSEAVVVEVLKKAGCHVQVAEVASAAALEALLRNTPKDTLVWANAYWVNGDQGAEVGLVEQIEAFNLPMVGSNLETLNLLLEKDRCQQQLEAAGIPIPNYVVFQNGDLGDIHAQISDSGIAFPMVVKPTKESRSQGIVKVRDIAEAVAAVHRIAKDYPFGNVIVEAFLPTDDITCGYIKLKGEAIILPSFNVVQGMDCTQEIFGELHYQLPPENEHQVVIRDMHILQQLESTLPAIVDLLGIGGVTRIDGRLDAQGVLRVFDINGMPGLNYPISALIKQCFSHFPSYSKEYLFECLVHTVLLENFHRYGMEAPAAMQEHHLFNLESATTIKLRSEIGQH